MEDPSGTMRMRGEPAVEKKKSDASRLAVPLQTHQMATVGRMPSRTREEELRQEGSGLPVWRTRPEQCACEESLRWKKKKVMLRGWQYLCRPTRWRLWEGCRAGRERKNSVRRGQGFLYGRPVRNNAHARRPERRHLLEANESQTLRACGGKKKKVMLRGWQYLCRPTRWRLWEGCRAGQERKNSVRKGQGFLSGRPVRNDAHARRYFSAAKGFWGSDEKKEIRVSSSHRVHSLRWKKKKKVMLRGWQYLCRPTRWRLWEGCRAGRERKNSVRRGQGFLYGGPVRNNAHARRYFSAAKGFWGSDEKKEIRVRSSHRLHDLLWCLSSLEPAVEKKKIDASRLAVPLQTHQMATVGRMPSRTREEELRQEGQGFLYGGCVRNNAHARRYFSTAKGFWGSDEKKRNPR
ncbi:uncharacterized protein LOC133497105 isoform X9 [Syngnathoides biaculeatus]|uniref:uncharacterized protein LOC133497105 isoform X9 n=1 Tax=Syngnathoides biaculeatus TaxID=300417 RepID=UPI002ADD4DFD|nr:uncharacterized protein LOC133497105 isoform X9 [Syngnathoides biaculeatus]